ncbi:MAG: hypothetical protein PWP23_3320 [Candidatus Sumerlaeota bacterium]|nr:hypothetical protein [Candidatus Sumerlaeota bacterium]
MLQNCSLSAGQLATGCTVDAFALDTFGASNSALPVGTFTVTNNILTASLTTPTDIGHRVPRLGRRVSLCFQARRRAGCPELLTSQVSK